jgi:hypothetical protein
MDVGMAEAGQFCDEPMHREEEGRPHQDVFGRDLAYGDQPLCSWDVDLDGQDVTMASWTFAGADSSVLGLLGTHSRLLEPPGSQRLAYWMMILPKKGQRLPFRGLTSHY